MRICSCFSTATELLYALGSGRSVVGRSERCDYPAAARRKPIIVRSRIASERLSSRGIHEAVQALRSRRAHHYEIDVALLKRLRPDVIVTQELCTVCAASHSEVLDAARHVPGRVDVVSINARRFDEVFDSITTLGKVAGRTQKAEELNRFLRREVRAVTDHVRRVRTRPRVWCAEWLEPLMAAGHWIPELVMMAGGIDRLGVAGRDSGRIAWQEILRYDPEVMVLMPCSFSIARTLKERTLLTRRPGWKRLRAVRQGRVFAVDTALFHRPGPRLIEGLRVLAALVHPDVFPAPSWTQARKVP